MRAPFLEAVIHEDADALFQAVHALKSSSTMIGALALSDFMKDLEPIGWRDKVSRSHVKVVDVGALYGTVRQAMHDELRKGPA